MIKKNHRKTRSAFRWRSLLAVAAVFGGLFLFQSSDAASNALPTLEARIQSHVSALTDPVLTVARHEAQQALEELGEASVDLLVQALESGPVTLRQNSADLLGYVASPRAGPALAQALKGDSDPLVRQNAARSLGELRSVLYLRALEHAALVDPDPSVRQAAEEAVLRIRKDLVHASGVDASSVSALSTAPGLPEVVYLVARRDLFVSQDGGDTWKVLANALPSQVLTLAVSPADPARLYAGVDALGLYASEDGGQSWYPLGSELASPPGARANVTAIAIDTRDPRRLWVATGVWVGTGEVTFYPLGILSSLDGGHTWRWVSKSDNPTAIQRLVRQEDKLFALAGDQVLTFPIAD